MRSKTLIRQPKSGTSISAAARIAAAALVLAGSLAVSVESADARAGRSGSIGTRGARTWSTPAPTPTSPSAQTMQRSTAPQTATTNPAAGAARPGGMFNRGGFMGGLMGGLIGAGLFGLLMGSGFFSGLGSLSGILGLLLQIALIVIVVRLAMRWFASRNRPAYAPGAGNPGAGGPMNRDAYGAPGGGATAPAGGAATGARAGFSTSARGRPIQLQADDFDMFERRLGEVQSAYSHDDRAALGRLVTPEMLAYFSEELDDYARDNVQNRLSDVKLLQGDLSEAWNEGAQDYATVAMRYELKDTLVDRSTGRVVRGDPDRIEQVVELWTFTRPKGGAWMLSAIQQGK